MKLILSPTKTMAFDPVNSEIQTGRPVFEQQAGLLIQTLEPLDLAAIQKLFKTSQALTVKTHEQIHGFSNTVTGPALFAFQGEAFKTLSARNFSTLDLAFAQDHLLIFSGLYGVLRPLDEIKPYRLDFGTPLRIDGQSLKQFWQKQMTDYFETQLEPDEVLINLASEEYSSILSSPSLKKRILTFQFREKQDGRFKNLSVRAKQARGTFARKIIINKITRPEVLKKIRLEGYTYSKELSSDMEWFFIR